MAGVAAGKNVAALRFGSDGAKTQASGVGKDLPAKMPNEPIQHYEIVRRPKRFIDTVVALKEKKMKTDSIMS